MNINIMNRSSSKVLILSLLTSLIDNVGKSGSIILQDVSTASQQSCEIIQTEIADIIGSNIFHIVDAIIVGQ